MAEYMSMTERVARAISEYRNEDPDARDDYVSDMTGKELANWRKHASLAASVIVAMREPSDGMVKAGQTHIYVMKDEVVEAWQAMIDIALSE